MYSNEKKGFSILDIIVKMILFGLFIFILVWLFNKKVPNMAPFYSNVFRENIKYMQEAAESYFTDDKMPQEVGDEVKMTLSEMLDKKLLLPFVDKDGKACDLNNSYVTITKQPDESWILKTNLECGSEKDYTIKVLGCHNYCKDNNCEKVCKIEKLTSYQYKKQVTTTKTKYSCKSGYTLNGKYCYKTVLVDTQSAEKTIVDYKTYTEDASVRYSYSCPSGYTQEGSGSTMKCYKNVTTYSCPSGYTQEGSGSSMKCYKNKTTCSTYTVSQPYDCNCTGRWSGGQYITSCSTCYKDVVKETCSTNKSYTDRLSSTTKSYTDRNSSTSKSYTDRLSSTSKSYTDRLSSTSKSYTDRIATTTKSYTNKLTNKSYYCKDNTWTLSGTKCTKTVKETSIKYECPSDYKLEGTVCKKYRNDKVVATAEKITSKSWKYTWSTKTSLEGWTRTGKTKTVNGKEICE